MSNKSSKRRILAGIIAVIAAIVLFGLTMHFIENRGVKEDQFGDTGGWGDDEEEEDEEYYLSIGDKDYISEDDIEVYVLAGTDGGGEDKGEGYNGTLADFILVAIIDNTTEKFGFFPIDRNTMVDVPIMNDEGDIQDFAVQQVCTSHWYGFDEEERNDMLCMAVANTIGGLDPDGYYVLNMKDIGAVNDAIGGVTVDIDTDMTELDPAFKEGTSVHLTGSQAEHFLRARMGVGDGTNKGRMQRQQQYMQKAYGMIIDQLRENPEYINDLYTNLTDRIDSDSEGKRISKLADKLMRYEGQGFITFTGKTEENDTIGEGIIHEEFYQDPASVLSGLRKVINIKEDTSEDDEEEEE